MSTRAIAPIVGTTHKTIIKDLQSQVVPEVPRPEVTGKDGKTYVRTTPVTPRAKARRGRDARSKVSVAGNRLLLGGRVLVISQGSGRM